MSPSLHPSVWHFWPEVRLFEQLSNLSGAVCSAEVRINALQISMGRILGHDCVILLDFQILSFGHRRFRSHSFMNLALEGRDEGDPLSVRKLSYKLVAEQQCQVSILIGPLSLLPFGVISSVGKRTVLLAGQRSINQFINY